MARPVTITEEQILEAARSVFLREGMNASAAKIARQAGVSEGSIFRRFPTKEALFRAAVHAFPTPAWVRELDDLVGVGDLRSNLVHIVLGIVGFSQQLLPLVMVAWGSEPDRLAPESEEDEPPPIRDCRLLARYLQREIDGGRLRPCDAEAVARMLFGASVGGVMDSLALKQPLTQAVIDSFAERLIDALWRGIAPEPCQRV
jgi:AcrR family transcriptional regulator